MATSSCVPSDLPLDRLSLYHVSDPSLSSIFVFHGPVSTANATVSSSRIQAHILTPAGIQSYPRITVSPAAPLYAAVNHLPRDKQGDEVCRGLAVSMLKYFAELSDPAKECLLALARAGKPGGQISKMFDEMHAADLANRMTKVENTSDIVRDIRGAFQERRVPWVDVDIVLPTGTIKPPEPPDIDHQGLDDSADAGDTIDSHHGKYSPLIRALGAPTFLPTSRLKRAPSQPTNVSRSKVFSQNQKQSLRLTMCEVVDTEERYVSKLYTLVCEVAEEFRARAQRKGSSSTSPNESDLATLFPPCLNEIYNVNMGFLEVIRNVLEETERDAIADITEDTELPSSSSQRTLEEGGDAIGAVAFANALLEWFPQFSQPYGDYMRAHNAFTQTLNLFMRDKNSSFSKRVYETGEQVLRSLLMEPVQRLPRYSLLIDTMTSSLPLLHPAVRPLLKARDIIKDICSLDDPSSTNHDQGFRRLKELVDGWPSTILPNGRLITAVDFNELSSPYHLDTPNAVSEPGIMLLYKNCLVLLSKALECTMTARGLMAELDNASSTAPGVGGPLASLAEIRVVQVYDLHTVRCMQSTCNRILFLAPASTTSKPTQNTTVDLLALEPITMYGGRAGRIVEEIIKAKIEGRFSESERESGKWSLRNPTGTVGNLGILACVFEDEQGVEMSRPASSKIRIVFDTPRTVCSKALSNSDLEVIISVSLVGEDQYRVNFDSIVGTSSSDIVTVDSFVPVLSKRLLNVLQPLHDTRNRHMTESLVHSNFAILKYLSGHLAAQFKTPRSFRPPSPTKLIANLLGGGHSRESSTSSSKAPGSGTLLGEFPKMPPPRANLSRSNTLPSSFPGKEDTPVKISVVDTTPSKISDSPFAVLEQAFAAYVLSLQSRSGNIVGRTLRARDNVDRSSVNELYNVLLEDPARLQAAAEVAVDTLFVAFETFMENAWKEHMGPVLDPAALRLLQNQFDTLYPREFEECFHKFLAEMSPQNRRALASLIRLLADLLDASGSDGDRGALTAAFAEVLTVEGDPMQHVSLLDRLVDDFDHLFDDFISSGSSLEGILTSDLTKTTSQTPGSIGSNASSFRKRFGFGLHRENSGEGKVASILRTLSKNKGPNDSEPGTPKGSLLIRSKSIDLDTSLSSLLRPGSRERSGASTSQEMLRRPGSSQEDPLSSVKGVSGSGVVRVRRKRRSSLSDLRPGTASTDVSNISPSQARPTTPGSITNNVQGDLSTPSKSSRPQTSQGSGSTARSTSPLKTSPPPRLGSPSRRSPVRPVTPSRKENVDPVGTPSDRSIRKMVEESVTPNQELKRRSGAPRTPALKERSSQTNGSEARRPVSSSSMTKSQKLRLQSPQKLRDRLEGEKKTQSDAQLGLKDELELIGQELRSLRPSPMRQQTDTAMVQGAFDGEGSPTSTLLSRMRNLELAFETLSGELKTRASSMEKDLEFSLVVSEKRAKKLDELYREASAENEALYGRFNSELSKLAKEVRTGDGEGALKYQLSSAMDEVGRLKKENFRLKREVGGLRAQQAAVALLRASSD